MFFRNQRWCIACARSASSEWKKKNRQHVRQYDNELYAGSSAFRSIRIKNSTLQYKKATVRLSDWYCKRLLIEQRGFSKEQITPDLIAAERALIKLKRAVKGIEV